MNIFKVKKISFSLAVFLFPALAFAFDNGFTLGVRANLTASMTDPHINKKDLDYLGGNKMKGLLGYITTGEVELAYIFGAQEFFGYEDIKTFGGLSLAGNIGLGQGFSGQISGQYDDSIEKQIDIYCRVLMSPVLTMGTCLRTLLCNNRMSIGFHMGLRMPLSPNPTYELYTNLTEEETKKLKKAGIDFTPTVGTLVISPKQMMKMNPVGFTFKGMVEYNQPVISTMELVLGTFFSYTVYRPRYVTMPKNIMNAAIANGKLKGIDVNFERDQIKSFYMNSIDFGISVGLTLKV